MRTVRVRPGCLDRPAPERAFTGALRVVCDRCGVSMGTKPSLAEHDGKVSHSKCPACVAVFLQEVETLPAAPRVLRAPELATICGLAERRLEELCPRQVSWGVEALTDLVGLLAVSGETAGAARLMTWLAGVPVAFTAGCRPPEDVAVKRAAPLTSPVPERGRAHKQGWAQRWEAEHA